MIEQTIQEQSLVDLETSELVEKAKEGDEEALSVLTARFYPKIQKFMYYRVDPNISADLAGDVFVKVLRNLHKQNGRFEPWLYRIARNVVIDWYRKKSRKPEVAAGNGTTEDMETEGGFSAVDARIDVHKAMEELSDNHRNFLVMKFLRGMTNREIEKVLDKKSGAVRALQFRALGALREALFTEEND